MKTLLLAVAIVMSLFAAGRANAQRAPGWHGNDLLTFRKEEVKNEGQITRNALAAGLCEGYVAGLIDEHLWCDGAAAGAAGVRSAADLNLMNHTYPMFASCIPAGVTSEQTIKVVVKFLDNHPELLHKPALFLVMQALHEAFPCPAEKPNSK